MTAAERLTAAVARTLAACEQCHIWGPQAREKTAPLEVKRRLEKGDWRSAAKVYAGRQSVPEVRRLYAAIFELELAAGAVDQLTATLPPPSPRGS